MSDSMRNALATKYMPMPAMIQAMITGPTADVAAVFWGRLNTPPPSIEPTTMAISANSPSLPAVDAGAGAGAACDLSVIFCLCAR